MKQEYERTKKQMFENFKILKMKVMSTDELISEHHKDCSDLEAERKLVRELRSKLETCYGEAGSLRIQVKKAIQANEPLKKTVHRFEYENTLKQQSIDYLTKTLAQRDKELEEYKKISNSSRVLQEGYKNKTESQERE